MAQRLIIVSGMYGSGKTTYCRKLVDYPLIHNDHFYDYVAKVVHYDLIKSWRDKHKQHDTLLMDAYMFGIDRDLSGLKKAVLPISEIDIKIIYTTLAELYKCQRSTPERMVGKERMGLSAMEDIAAMKHDQNELVEIFIDHLDKGRISSIEYIFREGDQYTIMDKDHFSKTIGGPMLNAKELLDFMAPFEQEKYQTIELDGKIIRHGSQECWKSWDNICKFNINWVDKFVCDIGCYFGYFSTKVLRARASKVFGIDQDKLVLPVYKEVLIANGFVNFETLLLKLGGGNVVPNYSYDILMAMNMLHHVRSSTTEAEYVRVLDSIFKATKEALFEVNNNQVNQIKDVAERNNFILKNSVGSHRVAGTRTILYFVRNDE